MKVSFILLLAIASPFIYLGYFFWNLKSIEEQPPAVVEPEPQIVICEEFPPETWLQLYPVHWGNPPEIQTRDYIKLPEPYGFGSSTLSKWIEENQKKDKEL